MALFVFDPAHRGPFEVPIRPGINFTGVSLLAFALEYTGRGRPARSKWMGAVEHDDDGDRGGSTLDR